jgi:hypothetical protein
MTQSYPIRIQTAPSGMVSDPAVTAGPTEALIGSNGGRSEQLTMLDTPGRGEFAWVTLVSAVDVAPRQLHFEINLPDRSRAYKLDVTIELRCRVTNATAAVEQVLDGAERYLEPLLRGQARRVCNRVGVVVGQSEDQYAHYGDAESELIEGLEKADYSPFQVTVLDVQIMPDPAAIEEIRKRVQANWDNTLDALKRSFAEKATQSDFELFLKRQVALLDANPNAVYDVSEAILAWFKDHSAPS